MTENAGEGEEDPSSSNKTRRYVLFMLAMAYALNFIDRQILVIVQEPLKAEMGLSDTQLGWLSGFAFAVVYITAGIPIAYLADRKNRRNIIGAAVMVWSGMTAVSGLAQNFTQLLLARIGVGIGEAGGSPPAHSMISDYYPPTERSTALAIYSSGLHFGIFLGFLLGAVISEALGWRAAFMAVGLPGILFALIFVLTVREPVRGRWETQEAAAYTPTLRETLNLLIRFKTFWYIAMGCGLTAFAGYGGGNFAPSFLQRSHGMSLGDAGLVMAFVAGGSGLIGTLLGGKLGDLLGPRDVRWYVWIPMIAGFIALPLSFPYLLLDDTRVVVVLLFFVSMAINTYLGPCLTICHGLVPPSMRALTSAVLFFVLNLVGLGMGPLTAGILSDYFTGIYGEDGLRYAILVVAMIAGLGVFMFFMASRSLKDDMAAGEAFIRESSRAT